MGSWGCPHEVDERCARVNGAYCVPGMRGCVLHGKVVFPDGEERLPRWPGRRAGPTGSGPDRRCDEDPSPRRLPRAGDFGD